MNIPAIERSPDFKHLLGKARDAHKGGKHAWECMSTGERLAVAFILNQPIWIMEMGYSMVEAIDRIEQHWLHMLNDVSRVLLQEIGDSPATKQ